MRSVVFEDGVGQIRIGRRPDLELSLPYSPLSGVHARLIKTGDPKPDHWVLEDLGSTNGTFIEDVRLPPGIKRPLTTGTQFKLAEVKLIFDGEVRGLEPTEVRVAVEPKAAAETRVVDAKAAAPKVVEPKVAGPKRVSEPKIAVPKIADPRSPESKRVTSNEAVPKSADPHAAESKGVTTNEAVPRTVDPRAAESKGATTNEAVPKSADPRLPGSGSAPKGAEPTETFVRRPSAAHRIPGVAPVPYLTAVAGVDDGHTTFRLEQRDHAYMFGRTRRCEFRVNTTEVSREHASFTRRADGIYVNDMGSVNGVLVNNTRVSEFKLFDGDLIQIGHIKLRLFDPTDEKAPRERPVHGEHSFSERTGTPSHTHGGRAADTPPTRDERSSSFAAASSEFHPAIAGALQQEGALPSRHARRPSVRVRLVESWESSSRFRYGLVIVAASLLAVSAVIVGFSLAG